MALGDILRDLSNASSLMRVIEERFRQSNIKPPLDPQKGMLRASGIPNLCAREEVLCTKHGVNRNDIVDPGLNLTFLHGSSLHWGVQNHLLGPMGVLFGTWRCDECATKVGVQTDGPVDSWAVPRPFQCGVCQSTAFTYVEPSFYSAKLRLTGHADGFLKLPGHNGMGILELKSIGQKGAREVQDAPQIGHMVQAHVYMMFTGLKWAKIVYWQKSEFGLKALIEHPVERDEETIERIRELVGSVWTGMAGGELPERICANATCPRAKGCAVAAQCFALDEDKVAAAL